MRNVNLYFIFVDPQPRKSWGGKIPPPPCIKKLESCWDGETAVHLVCLAAVALAAELRCLVAACCSARRVVRPTQEEHRRVGPRRQTGVCRTSLDVNYVHQVLVVAGGAHHGWLVVVGAGPDKEAVVLDELRRSGSGHLDRSGPADRAIPVVLAAACNNSSQSHRVIVQIVALGSAVLSEQRWDRVPGPVSRGQLLIDRVLHHRALCVVAVVAAQAGQ